MQRCLIWTLWYRCQRIFQFSSCFEPTDVVTLRTPWWPQLHSTYHRPQVSSIYFMRFLWGQFIPTDAFTQKTSCPLFSILHTTNTIYKLSQKLISVKNGTKYSLPCWPVFNSMPVLPCLQFAPVTAECFVIVIKS